MIAGSAERNRDVLADRGRPARFLLEDEERGASVLMQAAFNHAFSPGRMNNGNPLPRFWQNELPLFTQVKSVSCKGFRFLAYCGA